MRNALVFNKKYVALAMLIMLLIFTLYQIAKFSPLQQKIYRKVSINSLASLYITEANAGATTDFSYRYYLFDASKSEEDFTASLTANSQPFLITSDPDAFQKVENHALCMSVKGEIFAFRNFAVYTVNGALFSVPVYLTSAPYQ